MSNSTSDLPHQDLSLTAHAVVGVDVPRLAEDVNATPAMGTEIGG
jgi:hypothetical protein